jgi:Capsule assembly protein Wzi
VPVGPRRLVFLLLAAAMVIGPFVGSAGAVGLSNVPLHDPAYDELQKLLSLVGERANLATLPISRLEFAGLLRRVAAREDFLALRRNDRLAAALYRRLAAKFAKEIAYLETGGNPDRFDVRFAPMQTVALDAGYQRTDEAFTQRFATTENPADSPRGVLAPDANYRRPRWPTAHAAAGLAFIDSALELEDNLALFARPQLSWTADLDGQSPDEGDQEAAFGLLYAKTQFFNIATEVGRDTQWWGVGHWGTLLVSDNAPALEMAKLQSHEPFRWPWFLDWLGPNTAHAFLARLENDRHVPRPYLLGLRYTLMPADRLEIGVTRVVQFGGDRENTQGFDNLGNIAIGREEHSFGGADDTNQLAMFDFRLTVPETRRLWSAWRNLQLWWEYGYESIDWNTLNGVRVPLPSVGAAVFGGNLDFGVVDLTAEFVDLHTRAKWYRHYVYRSGYTYRGEIIGHPYDFGSMSTDLRLRWFARPDLAVSLLPAVHRWREHHLTREQRDFGLGLEADWLAIDAFRLRAGVRYWGQDKVGARPAELANEWNFGAEGWLHLRYAFGLL